MKKIDDDKLDLIKGGEIGTVWVFVIVSAVVVFLSGVIEGFTNPSKCN